MFLTSRLAGCYSGAMRALCLKNDEVGYAGREVELRWHLRNCSRYLLWHTHELQDGESDEKLLGQCH